MPFDLTPTAFMFRDDPEGEDQLELEGQLPDLGLPDLTEALNRRVGPPPTGPRRDQVGGRERDISGLPGVVQGAARAAAQSLTGGQVSEEPFEQAGQRPTRQTPEPTEQDERDFISHSWERGQQMATIIFGQHAEHFGGFLSAPQGPGEDIRRDLSIELDQERRQLLREEGRRIEQRAVSTLDSLGKVEPDNTIEEIIGVTLEQVPIMSAAAAVGGVGSLMGLNPIAGGLLAAGSVVYPLEQTLLKDELIKEGIDEDTATIIGSAGAIPIAALEAAVEATFGRVAAGRLLGKAGEEVTTPLKRTIVNRLANVAKGFSFGTLGEGGTETLQELASMGVVAGATGDIPTMQEVSSRAGEAFRLGAIAGGVFGTVLTGATELGDAALESYREATSLKERRLRRVQAATFDPAAAEPDTQIGNKVKVELSNGQTRWRTVKDDGTLGPFAKAPSREEVREHFTGETDAARSAEQTAERTQPAEPIQIPVAQAAERLSTIADRDITPEAVELNVRYLSSNYARSAFNDLENLSTEEYNTKKARLEEVALGEEGQTGYATRLSALANLRAMELMENQARATRQGPLDYSRAARHLAQLDDFDFQAFEDYTLADGREEEIRILNEAKLMRQNMSEFELQSNNRQLQKRLSQLEATPSRGVSAGSQVFTPSGEVAEVKGVQPNGYLEVRFQDTDVTQTIHPDQVRPIPKPGTTARLVDGTVVEVESLQDDKVTVTMPSGGTNVVDISTIEAASDNAVDRAAQQADLETQAEEAAQQQQGRFLPLPENLQAIDRRNGQPIVLTEIGERADVMRTADGEIIANEDIQYPSEPDAGSALISDIRESGGPIPVFEPGTQPSAEGRHINFIRVKEGADNDYFEAQIRGAAPNSNRTPSTITGTAETQLTILPQPYKPGYVTYAIELPAKNRALTDAAKRLLRHIGGKDAGKITASTLKAGFRITENPTADKVAVMRVPDALLTAVDHSNQDVAYLRRLTDLSFEISPELGEAYTEAAQAATEARDQRISGEDLGEAEMSEIRAAAKNFEITQQALKEEIDRRRRFWDAMQDDLRALMDPVEIDIVDALNSIDEGSLKDLPNIADSRAETIAAAREERGGFGSIEELTDLPGIGPATIGPELRAALTEYAIEQGGAVERRNNEIKSYLRTLPARDSDSADGFWLAFEHPRVPGFHLLLDKERIPTVVRRRPEITDAEIDQARVLVGEGIFGGVDSHSALEMGNIVEDALADGNLNIRSEVRSSLLGDPRIGGQIRNESVDMADFEEFVDKATSVIQSVRDRILSQGARQPGTRDVFHIRFITPEGKEIRGRTIGSREAEIEVPRHLVGQAQQLINTELQNEVPAHIIEQELMDQRRRTTEVSILDPDTNGTRTYEVTGRTIDEETGAEAFTILDPETGEPFQVGPSRVENVTETLESTIPIKFPRRLTEEEIVGSTLRELLDFRGEAKLFSLGQWRSDIPGVWGDIRQRTDGTWQVVLMEQPVDAKMRRFGTSTMRAMDSFQNRADAVAFLEERGFEPLRIEHNAVRLFESLPPVEEVSNQEGSDWNMINVNDTLTQILEMYWRHGFVPPVVRDYATRFATRWNEQNLQSPRTRLFSSQALRALGLFTPASAQRAAQYGNPRARVQDAAQPTVEIDGNEVIINRPTASELADNTTVLNGLLLRPGVSVADPAVMENAKKIFEATMHRERFYDIADIDNATIQERIVRVGRDPKNRQLGIIMGHSPESDLITVQVWDAEGNPLVRTVPKSNVKRTKGKKESDSLRAARDSMAEAINIPSTPEIGDSPYDAALGLEGVVDREKYIRGLRRRILRYLEGIQIADDGNIVGDVATTVDKLVPAWIRMKELGISNLPKETRVSRERVSVPEETAQARIEEAEDRGLRSLPEKDQERIIKELTTREVESVDEVILENAPMIPPALVPTLNEQAKKEIKNTFSTVSPYGELMARVKLGLIPVDKRNQISKQADEYGVDPDLPLYRKLEWLMQNAYDPGVAQYMIQLRSDIGAAGWLNAFRKNFPDQLIEMHIPAMGSLVNTNSWLSRIKFPRTVANQHPTMRMFHFLSEKARTDYGLTSKEGEDILKGLMAEPGMSLERRKILDELLQSPEIGAAQDRPSQILSRQEVLDAIPDDLAAKLDGFMWYQPYRTLRDFMVRGLRANKRNALVRGMHPEDLADKLTSDNVVEVNRGVRALRAELGLNEDEFHNVRRRVENGESFWILNRNSDAKYARPRSEVEAFLDLQEKYRAWADVPTEVRETMTDWMKKEYDFWARYGINNYAPRILQGSHLILLKQDGAEDKLVSIAGDGESAQEFFMRVAAGDFADKGLLRADAENLYIKYRKPRPDDTDYRRLGPAKAGRMWARMVREGGEEGTATKMARVAFQELNIAGDLAAPRGLHNQPRLSDLHDIIEDPFERYLVYWVRTARNNFLLDIEHAFETARSQDYSMSRARGVDPAFPHAGAPFHDGNVNRYMKELQDSYMGNPTQGEKDFSSLVAAITAPARMTNVQLRRMMSNIGNSDYNFWSDPAFLDAVYNPEYTTRRWAGSMTGFQSIWRLGLNLGGALINMTQHGAFTPAYLMSRGADPMDAYRHSLAGGTSDIKEYIRATRGGNSERGRELAEFAHRVGVSVDPARGTAQPGLNIRAQGRPIHFSDEGYFGRLVKDLEWISMIPFGTAERYVRLSSAFAARRYAQEVGLPEGAQVAFARDAVDNTQFQYYDQALPPWMRGSVTRVLTQFKQFPANAIKFEWDLMKSALGGKFRGETTVASPQGRKPANVQAAKALLYYNIGGVAAGGLTWFALRPLLAPLYFLLPYVGLSKGDDIEETIMNTYGDAEARALDISGTDMPGPEFMKLRNLILYGGPGLLDLQISQRLGVSGLDFNPARLTDLALGPSGSMYADLWTGFFGEGGYARQNPKAAFLGLGAAGAARLMSGRAGAPVGIGYTLGMTQLASLTTGNSFREWAFGTPEGRRMINGLNATFLRNAFNTMDVYDDPTTLAWADDPNHEVYDQNFNLRTYPGELNSNFEALSRITGLQTIRSAEERAYINYIRSSNLKKQELKRSFIDQAASAVMDSDSRSILNKDVISILEYAANRYDIRIDMVDVDREIDQRMADPAERARESEPLPTRGRSIRNR